MKRITAMFLVLSILLLTACTPAENSTLDVESESSTPIVTTEVFWPYGQYPTLIPYTNSTNPSKEERADIIENANTLVQEYWNQGLFEEQATPLLNDSPLLSIEGVAMPVINEDNFVRV